MNVVCSCGKQAEKKSFTTFEYFYCPNCKAEVGGKAPPSPKLTKNHVQDLSDSVDRMWAAAGNSIAQQLYGTPTPTNTSQQMMLPPDTAALKGDIVECHVCNHRYGTLQYNLPKKGFIGRGTVLSMLAPDCPRCARPIENAHGSVFVTGRGFV